MSNSFIIMKIEGETVSINGTQESYSGVIYFCLAKNFSQDMQVRMFDDNRYMEKWGSLFDDISPVRTEFYKRVFSALYQPRVILTPQSKEEVAKNIVRWGAIENGFFAMPAGELYPSFAEAAWNSGEPLFAN